MIDNANFDTLVRQISDLSNKLDQPLKDLQHLDSRVSLLAERMDAHIIYSERAVLKAEEVVMKAELEMSKRLDTMNEFRGAMQDQAKSYVTIDSYGANHRQLEDKIGLYSKQMNDKMESTNKQMSEKIEALQKIVWGGLAIVSFLVFVIPLVAHFL
jgi:hypothetical protein